jgi:hypothetical protein
MNELSVFNGNLPTVTRRAIQREGGALVQQAVLAHIHEQSRAALANTTMENVGQLSALAEHLTNVAPTGERRYHGIVDSYALGAASKIARW